MDLEMDYSQDLFNHINNEIKRLKQQMVENEEREIQASPCFYTNIFLFLIN